MRNSVRFKQLNKEDLEKKKKHLSEMAGYSHPGRLARKLRKRRGITIKDLSAIIQADSSMIELFEKSGDIRVWTELSLFQNPEEEKGWGHEAFERYIAALQPTTEEARTIRRDLNKGFFAYPPEKVYFTFNICYPPFCPNGSLLKYLLL